eukprot:Nk52_evm7s2118 gene=Nk52_evmTU7s2118
MSQSLLVIVSTAVAVLLLAGFSDASSYECSGYNFHLIREQLYNYGRSMVPDLAGASTFTPDYLNPQYYEEQHSPRLKTIIKASNSSVDFYFPSQNHYTPCGAVDFYVWQNQSPNLITVQLGYKYKGGMKYTHLPNVHRVPVGPNRNGWQQYTFYFSYNPHQAMPKTQVLRLIVGAHSEDNIWSPETAAIRLQQTTNCPHGHSCEH